MNGKFRQYLIETLTAMGFCVVGAGFTCRLSPDIWATHFEIRTAFNFVAHKAARFLQSLDGQREHPQ